MDLRNVKDSLPGGLQVSLSDAKDRRFKIVQRQDIGSHWMT
jgi:hypothetical protein